MLSIEACRNVLGFVAGRLGDTEVIALRDQLMELAGVAIALYGSVASGHAAGKQLESEGVAALPDPERQDVEERAAVIEFDAKLPRDLATKAALNEHRKNARRRRR